MLKLDINLLWTVVNVLVMYAVLRKFLFKPVQDVIAKRQQMVDANLADAETSKKEAAETMNAAQEKLRNVDNEAAARREAYEKQAEVEKQQLLADARKQADAIVQPARQAPSRTPEQAAGSRCPDHGTGPCDVREAAGPQSDRPGRRTSAGRSAGESRCRQWQLNSVVNFCGQPHRQGRAAQRPQAPGRGAEPDPRRGTQAV